MREKGKKYFLLLGAVSTALALVLDLNVSNAREAGITNPFYQLLYKVLEIIQQDLEGKGFTVTVLTICFFWGYRKIWLIDSRRPIRFSKLLALIFSVGYTAGVAYFYADTLGILFDSDIRLLKAVILLSGMYVLYLTAINSLYYFVRSGADFCIKKCKVMNLYEKNPWLFCWVIIMGIWMIHILIRYPGTMSYDNWEQLTFFFGYQTYSDWQPVFHTWLFGTFVQIGVLFGNANLGLFLFVIMQSLIMSVILAWSLALMKKWDSPNWLSFLTLGIYCIAPYFAGYTSFPIKDYLYTAFFVLLLILLMEWIKEGEGFWSSKSRFGVWIISGTLMILFRNNGKYIYIPLLIGMTMVELYKLKKKSLQVKKVSQELLAKTSCLVAPLVLAAGVTGIINVSYHVEHNSPKEMLSLPFQQTARYVRDYGDEITEEERVVIDAVLDYELLPEAYDELTSDPVKTTYHADTAKELASYFKVWICQFLKHPICYVEATWNQNYYLLAPNIDNIVHNKDCNIGEEIMIKYGILEHINFEVPKWMHGLCTVMVSYYSLLYRSPIIGLLNNVAFYTMLMLTIMLFMIRDGYKKELLVFLPLLLSLLVIILAPQIQNQPRYAFPIIYAMPTVVAFYIQEVKRRESERYI